MSDDIKKDAARYHYLKSRMRANSLHMDGNASYRLATGWPELRGRDVDDAVDKAMAAELAEAEHMKTKGGDK